LPPCSHVKAGARNCLQGKQHQTEIKIPKAKDNFVGKTLGKFPIKGRFVHNSKNASITGKCLREASLWPKALQGWLPPTSPQSYSLVIPSYPSPSLDLPFSYPKPSLIHLLGI